MLLSSVEENMVVKTRQRQMFTNQVYFLVINCRYCTFLVRIKYLIDFATTFVYIICLCSA